MGKVKSYTGIWSVEKVIYSIQDIPLPFPLTVTQIGWGLATLMFMFVFGNLPILNLIDNALIKYIAIPIGITYFMSQRTFDGKRPYSFLKSMMLYLIQPKVTYSGKAVKKEVKRCDMGVTVVESME